MRRTWISIWMLAAALFAFPAQAEVVEEIVAWVDGDIITRMELLEAEQGLVEELYRTYTGDELDAALEETRARLLMELIDQKILVRRAERLFDVSEIGNYYVEQFMRINEIPTEAEFEQALEQSGMTLEGFKRRLIDRFAPDEILRMEVNNRIAISDAEIESYHAANPDEFTVQGEAVLRELVLLTDDSNREARRAEIEAIRAEIAAGAEFAELAAKHSEAGTAEGGGKLGPLTRADLSDALIEPAFSLPVGQLSGVMEMPYGYHLLLVESRTETRVRSVDEVREELRLQLEDRKYQEELQAFLKRARAEAEWEVSPKYRHRLPQDVTAELQGNE